MRQVQAWLMPLALTAAPRDNASTEGVEETVSELWKTPVSQREDRVIGIESSSLTYL